MTLNEGEIKTHQLVSYPCFHISPAGMALIIDRVRRVSFSVHKKICKLRSIIQEVEDRIMYHSTAKPWVKVFRTQVGY